MYLLHRHKLVARLPTAADRPFVSRQVVFLKPWKLSRLNSFPMVVCTDSRGAYFGGWPAETSTAIEIHRTEKLRCSVVWKLIRFTKASWPLPS